MRRFSPSLLFIFFCLPLATVTADVLVLVHGYASNASSWQRSGVTNRLEQAGWRHASDDLSAANIYYLVNLPTVAPLMVQSNVLNRFLLQVRKRHPDDEMTVVGHSAGGVVGRLAVLDNNPASVQRLITIAAPHLGTGRAAEGLNALDDRPFFCIGPGYDFLKQVFGGDDYAYLSASRPALLDLLPTGYGSVLDWANNQPHPDIEYHAVVRRGDQWVPLASQDMNHVPALKGKVSVWNAGNHHVLQPLDGKVILDVLALEKTAR